MLLPTAPGTARRESSAGWIDYSNASEGYITVAYTDDPEKRCKVRITKDDGYMNFDTPSDGTPAVLPLSQGSGGYNVYMSQNIQGTAYKTVLQTSFKAELSSPAIPYLYPNTYCWYAQGSKCVELSYILCAKIENDRDKLAVIYGYIVKNITYDFELAKHVQAENWWLPSPDEVLTNGKSICWGYASLLAGLCRPQGIPCSIDVGHVRAPNGTEFLHAYNRVMLATSGIITEHINIPAGKWFRLDTTFAASGMSDKQVAEWTAGDGDYKTSYRG